MKYTIDHIGIYVSDIEKAILFYSIILGQEPTKILNTATKEKIVHFSLKHQRFMIELLEKSESDFKSTNHFCMCVEDIDAYLSRIPKGYINIASKRLIFINEEIQFISDFEGNLIELIAKKEREI